MTIEEVYNEIVKTQYRDDKFIPISINEKAFKKALYDVISIFETDYKIKIAELEAKVFTYEEIIKKSNFRGFIDPVIELPYIEKGGDKE